MMKKLILLISTLLVFLIGCGNGDNLPSGVKKILFDGDGYLVGTEELNTTYLIDSNKSFQDFINTLNSLDFGTSYGDEEIVQNWIYILQNTDVDFNQSYVFIYTPISGTTCEYEEHVNTIDNNSLIFKYTTSDGSCDTSMFRWIYVYEISRRYQTITVNDLVLKIE
jgi:hypothetical protein